MDERKAILTLILAVFVLTVAVSGCRKSASEFPGSARSLSARGISPTERGSQTGAERTPFAVTVHNPTGPPTIKLTQADPQGRVGEVACSTCHSVREPNFKTRIPADLDVFHQNMTFAHGKLTCYACHHPTDSDALRLADSTKVEFTEVMTLCAQCHGSQARDYEHGAHGGMNGYWDLNRGPRTRNSCVDCHDPHAPQFPGMKPTFKPRDRFLSTPHSREVSRE